MKYSKHAETPKANGSLKARFTITLTFSDGHVEKRENLDIEQLIGEVYLIERRLIEEPSKIREVKMEVEDG